MPWNFPARASSASGQASMLPAYSAPAHGSERSLTTQQAVTHKSMGQKCSTLSMHKPVLPERQELLRIVVL